MVRAVGENSFQPKIGFKTRYGLVANPFAEGLTVGSGVLTTNANRYYRRGAVKNLKWFKKEVYIFFQLQKTSSEVFFLSKYLCKVIWIPMFCKFSKMTLEERRAKKLKMYNFFEESLEERLAGVKAAKAKLEEQMAKDPN